MRRIATTHPQINPVARNYPERLRVVRAASVRPSGVYTRASAFVVGPSGCWRPGQAIPPNAQPSAMRALERHAEHAASLGVFEPSPEGRRAA